MAMRNLTLITTSQMRSIQRDWLNGILNLINQHRKIGLGERTIGLVIIGCTVCGAWDGEEFIP